MDGGPVAGDDGHKHSGRGVLSMHPIAFSQRFIVSCGYKLESVLDLCTLFGQR